MPTNGFLPFAKGAGANVLSDAAYAASPEIGQGVQIGVADPQAANKAWLQTSIIASMIGQFITDLAGVDANDSQTVAVLETNFKAALAAYFTILYASGPTAVPAIIRPSVSGVAGNIQPPSTLASLGGNKQAAWIVARAVAGNAAGTLLYGGSSLSLTFNGNNTGANGMDTGTLASNADTAIYIIFSPTANNGAGAWATLGTSACRGPIYTGSNMPAGYTASILLSAFISDNSGYIPVMGQIGPKIWPYLYVFASGLTATTATGITVPVPAGAIAWTPQMIMQSGAPAHMTLGPATNAFANGTVGIDCTFNNAGNTSQTIPFFTSKQAYYSVSGGSWSLYVSDYTIGS